MILRMSRPVGEVGWSGTSPVLGTKEFPDVTILQLLVWSPVCKEVLMGSTSPVAGDLEAGCPCLSWGTPPSTSFSREMSNL